VDVEEVSLWARGRRTLRQVGLSVAPGTLVAIAGPSGAGKTMLLETMAGLRVPGQGSVRYDGADRYAGPAAFRGSFGYVPQDDIIHTELPLGRMLRHACRLRLPAATPREQAQRVVRNVLGVLGLTGLAGREVGALSGGERKRASIAVELLTAPRVFFLDEPTSGLDPATAASFMRLLRRLADGGATVVLTTHNIADAWHCDQVVFLAGGSLAFAGPPAQACGHFAVARLDQVYERLTGEDTPRPPAAAPAPAAPALAVPAAAGGRRPAALPGAVRQWRALTLRTLDLLAHSRLTLAILLGSPLMILAMFLVLFRPGAFAYAHPSPNTALMTVFWIAFGGFFCGLTYGLPQVCTELAILRRERLAGLRLTSYLLSKLAVLVPLLAVVDAATLGVLRGLGRLPAAGWGAQGSQFVTLLLASLAALALGLLTSATVAGPAQAMVALPMLCFPQVLFSGAILPVPLTAAPGRAISYLMSDRWAFEALGRGAGLPGLWAHGRSPLGPQLLTAYGGTFGRAAWADWLILGGFAVVFLAAAGAVVSARCGDHAGWPPRRARVPRPTGEARPAPAVPAPAVPASAVPPPAAAPEPAGEAAVPQARS
jgi:ABC-type multidrug transport system ATPase subunit